MTQGEKQGEKILPLVQRQRYEAFKQLLEQMHQMVLLADADNTALRLRITTLEQVFRDQLLSVAIDDLSLATQHWVQSYQVEIDKQLRLLKMDVLFLQAARQAETTAQRRQQVCDRLETLQRYCKALLGEEERGEG